MTKPQPKTRDVIRMKSFCYWIRQALAELKSLTPEARAAFEKVLGDLNLQTFTDLETLEKALRKLSLFG